MAYNCSERFPPASKYYHRLDPGAYQRDLDQSVKPNKVPFLSKLPRNSSPCGRLWTHALYKFDIQSHIPNCTSLKSVIPRFPYEAFSKEDLEALLCRCGIQSSCECPTEEPKKEKEMKVVTCQGKVKKRIFIGPTPKPVIEEGLSVPSKQDHGFEILPNGKRKRLLDKQNDNSPPFYDAHVYESTAYYTGCKWSKWTSKRSTITEGIGGPGPADYYYVKQPTDDEICIEKFRSYRRKTSKQLRFMEMVQQRNVLDGRPGPATYSPELPKRYEVDVLGPKSVRFLNSSNEQRPGPADHWIKRTFDLPESPEVPCHAKLPEPSIFGIKAARFKPRCEEGPSPASYNTAYKACQFVHCPTAPFGSSSVRFKEPPLEEEDDDDKEEIIDEDEQEQQEECPILSWEFKSKTIRMKPLAKILNEPSPADLPQSKNEIHKDEELQYKAPFCSSESRFQPWYNWMPVLGRVKTPGPCYYNFDKPKCYPAVSHGPICRATRFPSYENGIPSPNQYRVGGGVETILKTHNHKLKGNIENQHKFIWEPPIEPRRLTYEEREALLLSKSIALLDENPYEERISTKMSITSQIDIPLSKQPEGTKHLRCFVYGMQTTHCT